MLDNQQQFVNMRQRLLNKPTFLQSQRARSATSVADLANDQEESTADALSWPADEAMHHMQCMFVHYTHEKRFRTLKRDVHRVYDNVVEQAPVAHVKLVVGDHNRRDARHELINKRPKRSILQANAVKRRYSKWLGN